MNPEIYTHTHPYHHVRPVEGVFDKSVLLGWLPSGPGLPVQVATAQPRVVKKHTY